MWTVSGVVHQLEPVEVEVEQGQAVLATGCRREGIG